MSKNSAKSSLVSRNVTVGKKRTSLRLEPEMWQELKNISNYEGCSISDLVTLIRLRKRDNMSLTSSVRLFVMLYYRSAANLDGHKKAGHGDFNRMLNRASVSRHDLKDELLFGTSI